ncbi:hypothetical protein FQZ97_879670 [compost metagenome]
MVFPARVADGDHGVRQQALEEVGAGLQRAGPADGLGGDHAAFGQQFGIGAEQQLLHALVIGGDTFDRQVAARRVRLDAGLLGGLHGAQQRQAAFLVVVHANPQVDLSGTGIGIERFVQSQDGVAGGHFDGGEQTHLSAALKARMWLQVQPFATGAGGCVGGSVLYRSRVNAARSIHPVLTPLALQRHSPRARYPCRHSSWTRNSSRRAISPRPSGRWWRAWKPACRTRRCSA